MKFHIIIIALLAIATPVMAVDWDFKTRTEWEIVTDYDEMVDDFWDSDPTGVKVQEEMAIGASMAQQIITKFGGLIRDPEMTRQVTFVGRSVGRYSNRPHMTYRFGILNSLYPDAYSTSGGYIFITKGAYDACQNYDQLAALLAHEIYHLNQRDALRAIAHKRHMFIMSRVIRGVSGDEKHYDKTIQRACDRLMKKGFTKEMEYAADYYAREICEAAGYRKLAMDEYLLILERLYGRENKNVFPTHPPVEMRLRQLGVNLPPQGNSGLSGASQRSSSTQPANTGRTTVDQLKR